ncbi:uncharacterized protein LOC121730749 [Aricia agestis]|uniref:uncharacterized protein LOC121730749 n=1 Tax=Aricia agestis TaxID=91739 RepID=UPI001C205598|nr:uncharacterized protein LOC121730749 [Aricia agestis]
MFVPHVKRCCFCLPLRSGIILFAYVNIIFSVLSVACLVMTTELQKVSITNDASVEVVTSTVLFSILGMGVILNFLLLIAGYQKDICMLRLYIAYLMATMLAALVPIIILLSRKIFIEVTIALIALALQLYVIILVRSEVIKLEEEGTALDERPVDYQDQVEIQDCVTLL